jgi:hypothetical protein
MRGVQATTMRAYRYARFNSAEITPMIEELSRRRGMSRHRDCVVNDFSAFHAARLTDDPHLTADDLRRAMYDTRVEFLSTRPFTDTFRFTVMRLAPRVEFTLSADARYVSAAEIEAFLLGVERLLVAAATVDAQVGEIGDLTGVRPVDRGPGWVRVDSCWIELAAAQRVLDDAVGARAARVFAVPAGCGEHRLLGYVATEDGRLGPAEIHAASLARLADRHAVMTPQRYILCAQPPDDMADLAAWQRQAIRLEGSGR